MMPCERVLEHSTPQWSCASWRNRSRSSGTESERVTWSDGSEDDRSLGPTLRSTPVSSSAPTPQSWRSTIRPSPERSSCGRWGRVGGRRALHGLHDSEKVRARMDRRHRLRHFRRQASTYAVVRNTRTAVADEHDEPTDRGNLIHEVPDGAPRRMVDHEVVFGIIAVDIGLAIRRGDTHPSVPPIDDQRTDQVFNTVRLTNRPAVESLKEDVETHVPNVAHDSL